MASRKSKSKRFGNCDGELAKAEADIMQKFLHKRARSLHGEMQHGRALDSGNFVWRVDTSGCFGGELSLGFSCFTFVRNRNKTAKRRRH